MPVERAWVSRRIRAEGRKVRRGTGLRSQLHDGGCVDGGKGGKTWRLSRQHGQGQAPQAPAQSPCRAG